MLRLWEISEDIVYANEGFVSVGGACDIDLGMMGSIFEYIVCGSILRTFLNAPTGLNEPFGVYSWVTGGMVQHATFVLVTVDIFAWLT